MVRGTYAASATPVSQSGLGVPAASEAFAPQSASTSTDEQSWIDAVLHAAATTMVPALVLFAVMAVGYAYRDVPFTYVDEYLPSTSTWLPLGAVAVPASFFIVHLMNRRYGAVLALIQIGLAWTMVAMAALGPALNMPWEIQNLLEVPPNVALGMAASLAFAQAAAAITFAGARSWRWWTAPFNGSSWGSAVFALTFFPATQMMTGFEWPAHMATFFLLSLAASVALLIVYWLARPVIDPLPGLGGY